MNIIPVNKYRALQWTLVNVFEANLFEVFPEGFDQYPQDVIYRIFIARECALAYQQCHYCGRLDNDPRGKSFGRLKFCHLEGCPFDPAPAKHTVGCCYGDWKREKNNVSRRCRKLANTPERVERFSGFLQKKIPQKSGH